MLGNRIIFIIIFSVMFSSVKIFSQNWINLDKSKIDIKGQIDISPLKSIIYKVDDNAIKALLWNAPKEKEVLPSDSRVIISLPEANGKFSSFKISEYEMMESGLASKYPDIKTFHGISTTDPYKTVRIDYTNHGIRAMIMSEYGNTYIDHYQRQDKEHKVVYYKNDLERMDDWKCHNKEELDNEREIQNSGDRAGDCIFRSYRLAVATTAEYSNFHGATSSGQSNLVLSAVTTVINRINGVLEKDMTIRFLLVSNNSSIFFYNTSSDPFTSGNVFEMVDENQTTCDATIGSANYDIGHVFDKNFDNGFGPGTVCQALNKANGATSKTNPSGDPFSIDYVIHEMGHQLGANHTQYNSCNRFNATAMESGSGSTIMGYAGICAPNVQNHSDAYFHAVSIGEIKSTVQAQSCHGTITFNNNAPSVSALSNFSIPISTPFVLTASATDPNNNPMTYCWEQFNNTGNATQPPVSTNTQGPMFRSLTPSSSSSRYFPPLANVLAGTSNTWEVLPSVGRTMNFRVTVRDLNNNAGCTSEQNNTITTVAGIGPFTVTSQNTPTSLYNTEILNVTWNVANTTNSPVNCANVNILLSTNGGLTFPITLVSNTPNDGAQGVSIPSNITTTNGRIMVIASNNVFYNVNGANITINSCPFPILQLTTGTSYSQQAICLPSSFGTYIWYHKKVTDSNWNVGAGGSTITLSPLQSSTQYQIKANINIAACNNPTSNIYTFTTGAPCSSAPDFSAQSTMAGKANLSSYVTGGTTYLWEYKLNSSGTWTSSAGGQNVTISGLNSGGQYNFRHRVSCTGGGLTGYSPTKTITIL